LIAPGELLSIFGAHFVTGIAGPSPGLFPASIDGITVAFNGVAGPLLYVSPQQINVQAPYEIANNSQVSLTLTCAQINESDLRTLPVTARNPVVFLDTAVSLASVDCHPPGQTYSGGPIPLALNSDGTRNTCSNPVSAGSVVRLFLSGLGVTTPSLVTGATNPAPGTPLNLPITFGNGLAATVVSATALPGSISGVWQVDIRMPPNQAGALAISLSVGSVPVRDTNLTIWVR
jgi:uncharacterized protein (TIGR03437 family)